jgi:DNA mismatch endonuclease (patch repair protein)
VARSNQAVPITRSENMSRIRGKDTCPELNLRAALIAAGLVLDAEARAPIGRPDVVLGDRRIAVFVDGC